jgi:hypothetical protein
MHRPNCAPNGGVGDGIAGAGFVGVKVGAGATLRVGVA